MSHASTSLARQRRFGSGAALCALLCQACGEDAEPSTTLSPSTASPATTSSAPARPEGWADVTHGNEAEPDHAALFDGDVVRRIDIRIEPAQFATLQSDLEALLAERPAPPTDPFCSEAMAEVPCPLPDFFGGGNGICGSFNGAWLCLPDPDAPFPGAPAVSDAGAPLAPDAASPVASDAGLDAGAPLAPGAGGSAPPAPVGPPGPPGAGGPPPGPGFGSGPLNLLSRDPIYVPVEVAYGDGIWTQVGLRYKGNSSLAAGNTGKLPFRLNFDRYEVEHPEIEDQRFYGFKELTFSSNWNDNSQLRELFANEVLRDRGVPAARASFVRVYVDAGNGPEYWGLYTMIEDPSDGAMLDAQLGSSSGNLYKPDGPGADWVEFDAEGFPKKTNEAAADWSDIQAAIAALHAPQSSPEAWRAALEQSFDVDGFLTWLAVNTVIVNWDTYGALAHNYYLYGDPQRSGQLRWIPWDHNLSMAEGGFFGMAQTASPLDEVFHTQVGEEWPLISRVLADASYAATYRERVERALEGLFSVEAGPARLRQLHALIEPYVTGADGERDTHRTITSPAAFAESIDGEEGLATHITRRQTRVRAALLAP
jgi:spore coat protein H